MENLQLKEGDNFIRTSKYGYVFGIVKNIFQIKSMDTEKGILTSELQITSTKDVVYNYKECKKILKFYSCDELETISKLQNMLVYEASMKDVINNYKIRKKNI